MKKRKLINFIKENKGTTMVEVLVAFLVVVLMMGMFSKIITVSTDFLGKSRRIIENTETFDQNYYKTTEREHREVVSESLSLSVSNKTSNKNTADSVSIDLPKGKLNYYVDSVSGYSRYSVGEEDGTLNPTPSPAPTVTQPPAATATPIATATPTKVETPTNTPEKTPSPIPTPVNPGVVPDKIPDNELARAVAKFFSEGWIAYDTIDESTQNPVTIYYKIVDGKMFILDLNMNVKAAVDQILNDNKMDNNKLIEIKDHYYSNTNEGKALLKVLEGNLNTGGDYQDLQLIFDDDTGKLMAIVYKSKSTKYGVLYGSYTTDSIKGLKPDADGKTVWKNVDGADWSTYVEKK